jgi:predicted component of type VI protein secretion system
MIKKVTAKLNPETVAIGFVSKFATAVKKSSRKIRISPRGISTPAI